MRETRILMGMPVTVEIADAAAETDGRGSAVVRSVFEYFGYIDEKFSTYREGSEISAINRGELGRKERSRDMETIFRLAEETKELTGGYFDIRLPGPGGKYDPSGIVKGWAILNAANLVKDAGYADFYVDAGGDIQTGGLNAEGEKWSVGIRNPWRASENVQIVRLSGEGIATSGTYVRGSHIYNPKTGKAADEIASLTVIGPDAYEADRFATAAFAMGEGALRFLEEARGLEGYMIKNDRTAAATSGFKKFTAP